MITRRNFLQLAAATPLVALAPWRAEVPCVAQVFVTPLDQGAYYLTQGSCLYRYVRFARPVRIGDLVFWQDGTVAGVSHTNAPATRCGWVLVRGPGRVRIDD